MERVEQTDDVLVDVQHLTKSFVAATNFFGQPTSYVQAVDDVSFQIRRGEAFGLVGESGCGKTTIGKMLVGLLAPRAARSYSTGATSRRCPPASAASCAVTSSSCSRTRMRA